MALLHGVGNRKPKDKQSLKEARAENARIEKEMEREAGRKTAAALTARLARATRPAPGSRLEGPKSRHSPVRDYRPITPPRVAKPVNLYKAIVKAEKRGGQLGPTAGGPAKSAFRDFGPRSSGPGNKPKDVKARAALRGVSRFPGIPGKHYTPGKSKGAARSLLGGLAEGANLVTGYKDILRGDPLAIASVVPGMGLGSRIFGKVRLLEDLAQDRRFWPSEMAEPRTRVQPEIADYEWQDFAGAILRDSGVGNMPTRELRDFERHVAQQELGDLPFAEAIFRPQAHFHSSPGVPWRGAGSGKPNQPTFVGTLGAAIHRNRFTGGNPPLVHLIEIGGRKAGELKGVSRRVAKKGVKAVKPDLTASRDVLATDFFANVMKGAWKDKLNKGDPFYSWNMNHPEAAQKVRETIRRQTIPHMNAVEDPGSVSLLLRNRAGTKNWATEQARAAARGTETVGRAAGRLQDWMDYTGFLQGTRGGYLNTVLGDTLLRDIALQAMARQWPTPEWADRVARMIRILEESY